MGNVPTAQRTDFLTYDRTLGIAAMEGRGFYFPADTAVGADGRLYTVNRALDIATQGVRVTAYDLESLKRSFEATTESCGNSVESTWLRHFSVRAPTETRRAGDRVRLVGTDRDQLPVIERPRE